MILLEQECNLSCYLGIECKRKAALADSGTRVEVQFTCGQIQSCSIYLEAGNLIKK